MAEVKCSSCGHTGEANESWSECQKCGHTLCLNCSKKEHQEKQDLEKLRKGSAEDRLSVTCPSCSYGMFHM